MSPGFHPFGPDAVLVRFATRTSPEASAAVRGALARIEAAGIEGVTEVAGALASVMIRFDPRSTSREKVAAALETLDLGEGDAARPGRVWRVPAAFDAAAGPQLEEAAKMAGVTVEEAVADFTARPLDILAIGFAPGQPYLGHLPDRWDIPRQGDLTPKVPAGAVVVALRQLIPFGQASTTGWRQVGLTGFRPFLRERENPFALRPGDRVHFVVTDAAEVARLADEPGGLGGAEVETP